MSHDARNYVRHTSDETYIGRSGREALIHHINAMGPGTHSVEAVARQCERPRGAVMTDLHYFRRQGDPRLVVLYASELPSHVRLTGDLQCELDSLLG